MSKFTTNLLQKLLSSPDEHSPSKVAIRISIWTIAVATLTLALAFAITNGYKQTLKDKLSESLGDATLLYRNPLNNWSLEPAQIDSSIISKTLNIEHIKSITPKLSRGVVLKNQGKIAAVELNGIDSANIHKIPALKNTDINQGLIISKTQAKKLDVNTGDSITIFILTTPFPTELKVKVGGIFEVGMEEVDNQIAWIKRTYLAETLALPTSFADSYIVNIDPNKRDQTWEIIDNLDTELATTPVAIELTEDRFAHIYDWLSLLDNNVTLLIIIVTFVIAINVIAAVLIIVLENTRTIGILLSLGMRSRDIERIFILQTFKTAFKGATIGLHIAIFAILIQRYTQFIKLDPNSYIVDSLPVELDLITMSCAFLGIVLIATIFSLLPAMIIARTQPCKALKFD